MSITEKELRDHFTEKFNTLSKGRNEVQTPEITGIQAEAIAAFSQHGFPLRSNEEYKYTPLTKALLNSININPIKSKEASVVPPFSEHLLPELKGYLLVYLNGQMVYLSEDIPEGLVVQQLENLDQSELKEIGKHLGKQGNWQKDPFSALNTAFFQQCTVVKVGKGVKLDRPIIIYHLSDGNMGTIYTQSRHLIIAEENSQTKLIEISKNITTGHQVFHNTVCEVYLKERAQLSFNKIQTACENALIVDNTFINQDKNSLLRCATVTTSGNIIRNNLNIAINGEHCESHMNGLYLVSNKAHVDNHTMVDHKTANSFSNELYKGIIDDVATGVFNGKIFVQPNAQKTNAFQSNKNILLSDKASMNTKPQLEIWADDVKCSHGATTGQLDADQVFYLRARGLDQQQARGLLLYAFATEILEHIQDLALREYLERVIADHLSYHEL